MTQVPSTMDADELEAVRVQLSQLNESQEEFVASSDPAAHKTPSWPEYFAKLNVLLSKHTSLSNTLMQQNLQKTVLHPKFVVDEEREPVLRTLLRTKLIPDIEKEESRLQAEVAKQEGLWGEEQEAWQLHKKNNPDGALGKSEPENENLEEQEELKWKFLAEEIKKIYDDHEKVAQYAGSIVDDMAIPHRRLPEPDGKTTEGFIDETGSKVVKEEGISLEEIIDFMSSGKRKRAH